jgi:flagellar hook-associated protein 2
MAFVMEGAAGRTNSIKLEGDDLSAFDVFGFIKNDSLKDPDRLASNARLLIDGVPAERIGNTFEVKKGISVTINENTPIGEEIEIEVKRDTTDIKASILNFVEEYNNLVKTLNDLHRTPRPKSPTTNEFYMPLTDEERRALSENEVRMWDEKAREGLLHRDPLLERMLRDMRMSIADPVKLDDGRWVSLSQMGITTTNRVSEGGILEINMERLDWFLENRAEDAEALFTQSAPREATGKARNDAMGVAERLNVIINNTIGTRGTITAKAGSEEHGLSLRNNSMYKDITAQNDRIQNIMRQLQRKEEQFYMMFSKLEAAMMRADQQMSSLMGLIGQQIM